MNSEKAGALWQKKRKHHPHRRELATAKAVRNVAAAIDLNAAVRHAGRGPAEALAVRAKAGANSSGARKFASSASRRSRRSITRMCGLLAQFVAESGKITPRRLTGVCTPHQRRLSRAIKQARNIALLPFAGRAQ
jgi:ribosomal protein S18